MVTRIVRDTDGIAHVRADSLPDAVRAQGYTAAQDRLWQMEFDRRKALGTLAEIVGPAAVASDRYHRKLGLADAALSDLDGLSDAMVALLEAYAIGVDGSVADADRLPPEFDLLGAPAPGPWQPWHCIAVYKVRHLWMGTAEVKLWRSAMATVLGPSAVARLWPSVPGVHIDPAAAGTVPEVGLDDAVADAAAVLDEVSALGGTGAASNNVVVAGSRTVSGLPLMAGDPHRAIDLPNVYWQNHLTWPDGDVIGLSFPGVPGFPHFGHNDDVAWSITHGMADDQDLYVERLRRRDDGAVEWLDGAEWKEATTTRTTIPVAGAAAVEVECVATANGPVVAGDPERGRGISLRWTGTAAPDTTFDCLVPQMTARSVAELDTAFDRWVLPCNNVLVADRAGSIGYRFRGRLAVRAPQNGWTVVDGSDTARRWRGFVDDANLWRVVDPERGFLVTANNPIGDGPYVSHDWAHPARAARLVELVGADDRWTRSRLLEVLGDTHSAVAASFARRLGTLEPASATERGALGALDGWDHHMDADSAAALVYAATRAELVSLLSSDLGAHRAAGVDGVGYTLSQAVRALHVRAAFLIDDDQMVPNAMLAAAFRNAVHGLTQRLGADVGSWRWGDLHRAGFHHPLAALRPDLAAELDRPHAVPLGGDNECLWASGTIPPSFRSVTSPVARYVFDLADWDASGWIVPHGVHGDPSHPHHADQLDRWAAVELAPMRFSRGAVDAATASTVDLGGGRAL